MPLNPKAGQDKIRPHARLLVDFMARKIWDDFGIDVLLAFEKEGILNQRSGPFDDEDEGVEICDDMNRHRKRLFNQRARAMPGMKPTMQDMHDETLPEQVEYKTVPTFAAQAVARIDGVTDLVESYTLDGYRAIGRGLPPRERIEREAFLRGNPVQSISWDPYDKRRQSALHSNFSLWRKDGQPVNPAQEKELVNAITNAAIGFLNTDLLLVAPSEQAFRRLSDPYNKISYLTSPQRVIEIKSGKPDMIEKDWALSQHFGASARKKLEEASAHDDPLDQSRLTRFNRIKKNFNTTRMQFGVPSSDARHDLTALMTLAAIYRGLQTAMDAKATAFPAADSFRVPKTHEGVVLNFKEGGSLIPFIQELAGEDAAVAKAAGELRDQIIKAAELGALTQPTLASSVTSQAASSTPPKGRRA